MKVFSTDYLNELIADAQSSPRKRKHRNIHESYMDTCQRLFNAIEPNSYIRPHRHATDPKDELLIAVRGLMALVIFDEQAMVTEIIRFGVENQDDGLAVGAEVPASTWHTVIALTPGCILLEIKAGPFDSSRPKDLAPWAPEEGSAAASNYLNQLVELAN